MGKNNNIDIRIIQLGKWQIPKSKSLLEGIGNNESNYLAIGYFDMIEIVKAGGDEENSGSDHPLSQAYHGLPRHRSTDAPEEYTMQELILFTDVREDRIRQERIEQFWEADSLLMFISLIHVDNESQIDKIIKIIDEKFDNREYLYYFSFDYSGIVLLTKNIGVKEYTELMFRLNYEKVGDEKLIRDSYSMFGLHKIKLKKYFEQAEKGYQYLDDIPGSEDISIVINIGIQNFTEYLKFIDIVEKTGAKIKKCGLLGRHDISIINDVGDLRWLVYMQHLLDQYTVEDKGKNGNRPFYTHETFVKVKIDGEYSDASGNWVDPYYDKVKEELDKLCHNFEVQLECKSKKYNGEYNIPIQAVKHSILSILKNRFAEDFVLCMYSSFCEFVLYLTEKMESQDDDPAEFEMCYTQYFKGLNSLVNSAMHSERQFIQATAFNALIYDVPSKIMAFYVALIYDMQKIIGSNEEEKYTFLLTPSFSNEIAVEIISYKKDKNPKSRILMVNINERSLYNPNGVARRMAHEVAHYVGNEIRRREYRKECFEVSIIHIIICDILHKAFIEVEDFYALYKNIMNCFPNDARFNQSQLNYSEDLIRVGAQIAEQFMGNSEVMKLLYGHVHCIISESFLDRKVDLEEKRLQLTEYISQICVLQTGSMNNLFGHILMAEVWSEAEVEIITKLVMSDIEQKIKYINRDRELLLRTGQIEQNVVLGGSRRLLERKTVGQYAEMLRSIYSEAFADIQMILLMNFGYKDYLNGFLVDEDIDLNDLQERVDDLTRISIVVLIMNQVGLWDELRRETCFPEESGARLQQLHSVIRRECIVTVRGVKYDSLMVIERIRDLINKLENKLNDEMEDRKGKQNGLIFPEEEGYLDTATKNVFINIQLFRYLLICVGTSVKKYLQQDNIERIRKLRKVVNTIIKCDDMKETFKTVCEEVNEYREVIFSNI